MDGVLFKLGLYFFRINLTGVVFVYERGEVLFKIGVATARIRYVLMCVGWGIPYGLLSHVANWFGAAH